MNLLESMIPQNIALFQALTATAASPPLLVLLAKGMAEYGPLAAVAVMAWIYLRGAVGQRHAIVLAGIAAAIALAGNFAFALAMYVPRPFEIGLGLNLLHHAPESSFPSDHATLVWALGFGMLFLGNFYRAGALVVAIGAATAWARVYLGAHFPLDMAGSLVISLVAAALVALARPLAERFFLPAADRGHDLAMALVSSIIRPRRSR